MHTINVIPVDFILVEAANLPRAHLAQQEWVAPQLQIKI